MMRAANGPAVTPPPFAPWMKTQIAYFGFW